AAAGNHAGIAQAMLDRGANASIPSKQSGLTPLHVAAAAGHRDVVDVLIAGDADVNARDAEGRTALAQTALAGSTGDAAVAGGLLDAGADPTIADGAGRTPLHHAGMNGHVSLIGRVANVRGASGAGHAFESRDTAGDRPLHAAVQAKHADAVRALIDAGAALNARGSGGRTALAAASAAGAPVA